MKKMIFSLVLLLTGAAAYAQNDLKARMELENAELTYSENRYNDALRHLDKTQELLGKWSHQIGYLRILSLDAACDYADMQSPDFKLLQAELNRYLKYAEENPDNIVMDRYREAYAIGGKMEKERQAGRGCS